MYRRTRIVLTVLSAVIMLLIVSSTAGQSPPGKPALPQTAVTLIADADATIRAGQPGTNFGNASTLDVSYSGTDIASALLHFNLNSLPANAVIDSATLEWYLTGSTGANPVMLSLFFATSGWEESTVTWNSKPSTEALGLVWNVDSSAGYKSRDVTSYARAWHDDSNSNSGVEVRGPWSGAYFGRTFESREAVSHPPRLVVTYHIEAPLLSGYVYAGAVGDMSHPLAGVIVALYGANNPHPDAGVFITNTVTTAQGTYTLPVPYGYEFYHIQETDLPAYTSAGATSIGGVVRTANWIEYVIPLEGKTLTDNMFWDQPPVLSGYVYAGDIGDESAPLAGVTVALNCSANAVDLGERVLATSSNTAGWYALAVYDVCPYYNILEENPPGYGSVGATSVGGVVVNADRIRYGNLVEAPSLTGNKFWDHLPDLVLESLTAAPNPVYPGEEVRLTAQVHNTGPGVVENAPVRFAAAGVPLDTRVISQIPPASSVAVTTTCAFSTTGAFNLTATVNPDGALLEVTLDNNSASAELVVRWEESPGWSRPNLALADLSFTPHRPDDGEVVTVTALLRNSSLYPVPDVWLELRIDGVKVQEQMAWDVAPGESRAVTLTWPAATPGRHLLTLEVDPDLRVEERSESDNRLDEWVRVAGAPNPLPDLEVEEIALQQPLLAVGNTVVVSAVVSNEGYSGTASLPVLFTLDGYELARAVMPPLGPGAAAVVTATWPDVGEGEHLIDLQIDPDDLFPDDSVQPALVIAIVVPGPQYWLPGTASQTRWKFIGPDTIANGAYVGRIDDIAISPQDTQRMVVAAPTGGVWLTDDGGQSWQPVADHLPSSGFSVVAFDPQDDAIIYAATGSSLWGGGVGLFKSTDSGAHWTAFADTTVGAGYVALLLRYTSANTLTILAGTDSGVWMWQGAPDIAQTTAAQWQRVWQQPNPTPERDSRVSDMLITNEATPHLYVAVFRDGVYRVAANDPAGGMWTRLSGSPGDAGIIKLGHSPANAGWVYAAFKRETDDLDIYRSDNGGAWVFRGRPDDDGLYNAFIGVHPANADVLYIGGVKGRRSTDGGLNFSYVIPYVHDDYKAVTFDPDDASVVYFTSDGGVYRCANNAAAVMNCSGLNHELGVTQFYDIALAASQPSRTIGGTQDNGNNLSDGSLAWTHLSHGGDGMYTAIDPSAPNTWFAEHQYMDSIARTTNGGVSWSPIGLQFTDLTKFEPAIVIHPTNGQQLLATWEQVYRTTNAGDQWASIGPLMSIDPGPEGIKRIAIDAVSNRYYAGTTHGRVWTINADHPNPTVNWTGVYTHPQRASVRGLLVDPGDPNVLYATFSGSVWRIVKLTHSGGWPGAWTTADLTGNFPGNRHLAGGPGGWGGVVRGLLKDPAAEALYVGTNRGVWQGRPVNNTWQWFPDTCGLPLTYVSDLERHVAGNFVRAATYGRGVYERSLVQPSLLPDAYDWLARNDTLQTVALLTGTWGSSWLAPGLTADYLNLDRLNDVDYFTVHLPPASSDLSECLSVGDPSLGSPKCAQCTFGITLHAPETPDPFELRLYNADGSLFKEATSYSNLTYQLDRPRDFFPGGVITLSVRSPTGCRSEYDLHFSYHRWYCEKEAPDILFDPPIFKHVMPEMEDVVWIFPADPHVINQAFVGQAPVLPEQRLIFHWDRTQDFLATFSVEGAGGLNAALYNANNQPVAFSGVRQSRVHAAGALSSTFQISAAGLEAGWYALNVGDGDFPTYFGVTFNTAAVRVYLPLILKNSP